MRRVKVALMVAAVLAMMVAFAAPAIAHDRFHNDRCFNNNTLFNGNRCFDNNTGVNNIFSNFGIFSSCDVALGVFFPCLNNLSNGFNGFHDRDSDTNNSTTNTTTNGVSQTTG